MMYTIYIEGRPLYLVDRATLKQKHSKSIRDLVVEHFPKRRKRLRQAIDNLEKGSKHYDSIWIVSDDWEQLKEDFFSLYTMHRAGGGLVYNDHGEILAIYRRGHWDLPKGKQDPGESIEATALREVEEETGCQNLRLGGFVGDTYHSFRNKSGKRIMKLSSWFRMYSNQQTLQPQVEEDIEAAVWVAPEVLKARQPIYPNIVDILELAARLLE